MSDKSIFLADRFAEIRAANPNLGFAFYNYDPNGVVTFEIVTPDGESYQYQGKTMLDALNAAFPPSPPTAPMPVPATKPEPAKPGSIFD